MCGERHVVNKLLVSVPEGGDVEAAVPKVLNATGLDGRTLERVLGLVPQDPSPNDPPGVRVLKSKRNLHFRHPPHDDGHACDRPGLHLEDLIDAGLGISPNYIMVQMYHGRVLPISFPRPATRPDTPGDGSEMPGGVRSVRVAIIDSALVADTGLGGVTGPEAPLSTDEPIPAASFHGTFIAGIVRKLEPRADVELVEMEDGDDDGFYNDAELARQIMKLVKRPDTGTEPRPDIISLSLGSVTDAGGVPVATQAAVRAATQAGIKIFAAAGNDGADELVYPAKFDGVHTVGAQAIDPGETTPRPAAFTNNPGAVDFWAAGVDLRSFAPGVAGTPVKVSFKDGAHGHDEGHGPVERTLPTAAMIDIDFEGGACWSGCSVAVPVVAATCARLMIEAAEDGEDPIPALRNLYGGGNNGTSYEGGAYPVDRCGATNTNAATAV